jgi:hypothetical protein
MTAAFQFAEVRPPSASPTSLDPGLQVDLQIPSNLSWKCISKFTRLWCGESVELERRKPIISTPLHRVWYLNEIHDKLLPYVVLRRKMEAAYDRIHSYIESHRLCGFTKLGMSV